MTVTIQNLTETFAVSPASLSESKDGSYIKELSDGRFRVRCKGQHCYLPNTKGGLQRNRNGRRYPAETTWGKHTAPGAAFYERVKSRRVTGQLEHPVDGKSAMGLAAMVVTEVSKPDPKTGVVMVTFETMSTDAGRVVEAYIRDGVGFGLSSRGNGSIETTNEGIDEVQPDFEPITFDCVVDESTPGAEVAARTLREARERLLESAQGDEEVAARLALREAEEAVRRDGISEQRSQMADKADTVSAPAVYVGESSAQESYTVAGLIPFSGTMITLEFDSGSEAKQASAALTKAGFQVHLKGDDSACVYTQYDDPTQAEAHILRVLQDKKIEPTSECFGLIRRGKIVWEDKMAESSNDSELLNHIQEQLSELMEYRSFSDVYEEDDEEDEEDEEDAEEACMYGEDEDEEDDEDDEEDEEDDAEEALPGVHYGRPKRRRESFDDMFYEDDDEEEDEEDDVMEYVDMPMRHEGVVVGYTRCWLNEDDEVVDIERLDLDEAPGGRAGEQAMFAKAFARDDKKATKKSGKASKARGSKKGGNYYRKFRRGYAKKHGLSQKAAASKGKQARRISKNPKRRRKVKESADRPVTLDDVARMLHEAPGGRAGEQAMFAKAFARDDKKATKKSGKASKARGSKKGGNYYRKFRRGYAKKRGLSQKAAASKGKQARRINKNPKRRRKVKESVIAHDRDDLLIEATLTLLGSPYVEDIQDGCRMVIEAAHDWPHSVVVDQILPSLYEQWDGTIDEDDLSDLIGVAISRLEGADSGRVDNTDTDELEEENGRLREENTRLTDLVGAMRELHASTAVQYKVESLVRENPSLATVRERLENLRTVGEVVSEANNYLTFIKESSSNGSGSSSRTSVSSSQAASGLPQGQLDEGNLSPSLGGKTSAPKGSSSRVAEYRRRQRGQKLG